MLKTLFLKCVSCTWPSLVYYHLRVASEVAGVLTQFLPMKKLPQATGDIGRRRLPPATLVRYCSSHNKSAQQYSPHKVAINDHKNAHKHYIRHHKTTMIGQYVWPKIAIWVLYRCSTCILPHGLLPLTHISFFMDNKSDVKWPCAAVARGRNDPENGRFDLGYWPIIICYRDENSTKRMCNRWRQYVCLCRLHFSVQCRLV